MKISIKLFYYYMYMAIFFNFSPTSNHLHPLQVENCDSNSRLVVDEDDNGNLGLKWLKCRILLYKQWRPKVFFQFEIIIQMSLLPLSDSFEYLCYGSTTIRNILILSAPGSSSNVRI